MVFCPFLLICHDSFHVIQTLNFTSAMWRQCCWASDLQPTAYRFSTAAAGSQEMFTYYCIKRNSNRNYCRCNYNCQCGNSAALSPRVPFRGLSVSPSLAFRCFWRCDVRTVQDSIHNESMTPLSLFSLRGSGINNELWSVKYHHALVKASLGEEVVREFLMVLLLLFFCFLFFSVARQVK